MKHAGTFRRAHERHLAGDTVGALRQYCALLKKDPCHYEANLYAGLAFNQNMQYVASIACLEYAVRERPTWMALMNLAKSYDAIGDRHSAGLCYARANTAKPNDPMALYGMANVYRHLGDAAKWREMLDRALALPHEHFDAIYDRAFAKLILGDASGWADYNARWVNRAFMTEYGRPFMNTHRAWSPKEDISDQTLLVSCEQGYGDAIMMSRYFAAAAFRCKQLVIEVTPTLVELFGHNFGHMATIRPLEAACANLPKFDRYAMSMSLPAIFGVELAPAAIESDGFGVHLPSAEGARVGLVWAGRPEHANDRNRSMRFDTLQPMIDMLQDVTWYSLQAGDAAAECYSGCDVYSEPLDDWTDTANLIEQLDAVVTVDTAVAHLAATMGKPTLIMLPFAAEYRWGLGDTTPWYPTAKLFRQRTPGDWAPVIAEVAACLLNL